MSKRLKILISVILVIMVISLILITRAQTVKNIDNETTPQITPFANTLLSIKPSENIIKTIGEILTVDLWFQTENGAKVDGIQAVICYGDELVLDETNGVVANQDAGFSMVVTVTKSVGPNQSCATLVVTSYNPADDLFTTTNVATLNFSTVKAGSGNIYIDKDTSMVTGDNPDSSTNKTLAITGVEGTTYEILE